ncbi:MAG TPA: GGDEF domain-containing protein [Stellaceae bacterium]|jgi:diguanylate cyclase (GGDEF)-like protein|nr:GGDEF domain-containing protein [Stellaceae bacterium]
MAAAEKRQDSDRFKWHDPCSALTDILLGIRLAMSVALTLRKSDEPYAAPRDAHFLALVPAAPTDQSALLDWAHGVAAVAAQRVAALEQRLAHLETLIASDELTGLLNRRGFLSAFGRANAAATRGGPAGVIVVCDLDGFKRVNDQLGHAQGDELLRQLGAILRRKTRKMDAAARFGGDEFALMLIGVSPGTAKRKCQWLGRVIGTIGLSASFGVALFDGRENEEAVLHCADMAMYEDKRRNAGLAPDERD